MYAIWGSGEPRGNLLILERGVALTGKKIFLVIQVILFSLLVLVAAKPAPAVLFQDTYSGSGDLGNHIADSGGRYLCNQDGIARVSIDKAVFFGGGTFSDQQGAHACILAEQDGTVREFDGGVFEISLQMRPSFAPGISRSTFVSFKMGDSGEVGLTRGGLDDELFVQGLFDDGTSWSFPLPDNDKMGSLRISVNPKSGDVKTEWQPRPEVGFVLLPAGHVGSPSFKLTITSGGGADIFTDADSIINDLVVTSWEESKKKKKEKKEKKDKKEKSK